MLLIDQKQTKSMVEDGRARKRQKQKEIKNDEKIS
jgi:hypothetical protein